MGNDIENIGRGFQETLKKVLRDYAEALFFAVLLALLLRSFVLSSYRVTSASMAPSLIPGDFILGFKIPYGLHIPFTDKMLGEPRVQRGDLAIFTCRDGVKKASCLKRVVGLEGDRIEVKKGRLLRNGDPIYKYGDESANFGAVIIPPGYSFLVSNHWGAELDSFSVGPVALDDFEARAEIIWFSKPPGPSEVQWARVGQRIR